MKRFRIAALLVLLLALACGSPQGAEAADPSARATVPVITKKPVDTVVIDVPTATPAPTLPPTPTPTPEPTPTPTPPPLTGIKIGLDPGHQQRANINEEPIAPEETQTKMKCSSGTLVVEIQVV